MTWLLWVVVLWMLVLMLAGMWAVCESLHVLRERGDKLHDRVAHLEAGRGTLTALCCDLERQVHVLGNDVRRLEWKLAVFTDGDDEPFTPDTDMED